MIYSTVIEWDGVEVPKEFLEMPPGRYLVEPVQDVVPLTPEEEDGIIQALADYDKNGGIPLEEIMRDFKESVVER